MQLPDRLHIYELTADEMQEMRSQPLERLNLEIDCNLLVVVSQNFLLCVRIAARSIAPARLLSLLSGPQVDKKLQLFTFSGVRVREWVLESTIRYIKTVGGLAGREGLIVGCENGAVIKVFIDNPFSVRTPHHTGGQRPLFDPYPTPSPRPTPESDYRRCIVG